MCSLQIAKTPSGLLISVQLWHNTQGTANTTINGRTSTALSLVTGVVSIYSISLDLYYAFCIIPLRPLSPALTLLERADE